MLYAHHEKTLSTVLVLTWVVFLLLFITTFNLKGEDMEFSDVETTITINDTEIPCTFDFDYQPHEPKEFYHPEVMQEATITGARIEPRQGQVIDLFTKEFDWLLVIDKDIEISLENDAVQHVKDESIKYREMQIEHGIESIKAAYS